MEQALERRVRIIPATKKVTDPRTSQHGKQRVAAYCRVSTNNKEQINTDQSHGTQISAGEPKRQYLVYYLH